MADDRDAKQDERISVVEKDVAVLGTKFDNFEKVADERHTAIKGTVENTKASVDDFRKEAQAREEARQKREQEAATARLDVLKEPRTQVLLALVFLAVFAPQTLPLILSTAASYFGAKKGVEEVETRLDDSLDGKIEDAVGECCAVTFEPEDSAPSVSEGPSPSVSEGPSPSED